MKSLLLVNCSSSTSFILFILCVFKKFNFPKFGPFLILLKLTLELWELNKDLLSLEIEFKDISLFEFLIVKEESLLESKIEFWL